MVVKVAVSNLTGMAWGPAAIADGRDCWAFCCPIHQLSPNPPAASRTISPKIPCHRLLGTAFSFGEGVESKIFGFSSIISFSLTKGVPDN